jgi:hypothetical protein
MKPVVYDAGTLIAADRGERLVWAQHRLRLEAGIVPMVPSPVVAQASRTPRQVQMRLLLRGCEVVSFDEADAHRAGAPLGKSRTSHRGALRAGGGDGHFEIGTDRLLGMLRAEQRPAPAHSLLPRQGDRAFRSRTSSARL